MQSKAFHTHN